MTALRVAAILGIAACAGCGGGGGGGGSAGGAAPATLSPTVSPPAASQQSAGGMWFALAGGSTAMTLMIAETGEVRVTAPPTASSGPAFGYGAVAVTGNRVAGTFETRALSTLTGVELDCTLEGTVSTRVSMQVTVVCTDTAGTATTTALTFQYDARYEADSSLALIAGNYTMPVNAAGNSLNINGDGTLFGVYQNGPRCTLNGRVAIVDANFNLYRFEVLFSGCTVLPLLEGVTMTGFATRGLPGQKAGAFHLLLTAVVRGRVEFASVVYEPT